ncbi:hypothetical protein DR864_28300 (plasmid) [Runella rosea]|uniref:MORN repeat variant n=2 Tax=Runella rosea TaxID=2259595 RepID=A0A344TT07_9BACT|nr:hypothetical protein DR864_28300 [Runella rosea]
MKYLYKIAFVFLLFSFTAQSQEKLKTLVAISAWKRVNTLTLFETTPELEKAVAEVKKDIPTIKPIDNQPTTVVANSSETAVPETNSKRSKRNKKPKKGEPDTLTEQTIASDIKSKKNSFIPPKEVSTETESLENESVAVSRSKKREKKPTEPKEIASTETKPVSAPKKTEATVPPKKKTPEPKPKVDNIVTDNTLSFQPVEGVKADLKPLGGSEKMYFSKQNRYTSKEKAYFYRVAQFDPSSRQPKGWVEDFYTDSNKPKFKGQYDRYNNDDEANNNKFDGTCEFYEEDGAKRICKYNKGRLESESKFNKEGQTISQAQYAFDGRRKSFTEYIFDKNGKQIGTLIGGIDPGSGLEKATQQLFLNDKFHSAIEYIGGCPSNQGEFMSETGVKYNAVFQDFTCSPDNDKLWKFSNSSNFTTTHFKDKNSFSVRSTPSPQAQAGFLHTPVSHDFYKKPFEIEAIFELSDLRSMPELGIVWQYMDPKNYAYFKINTAKKIFEINDIEEDTPDDLMKGVKNQLPELTDNQVKLTLKKVGDDFFYLVNDQALPFAKVKFPRLERDSKTWNIGFYFKASTSNESIILKHLEIKLL